MLHSRDKRLGEAIRQALSVLFQEEIRDPRLPELVTIRHVEVSKDLRSAKVYYSVMPDRDSDLDKMEAVLAKSAGFLRHRVAEEVNVKFAPELHFEYDDSERRYQRINQLLKEAGTEGEAGAGE